MKDYEKEFISYYVSGSSVDRSCSNRMRSFCTGCRNRGKHGNRDKYGRIAGLEEGGYLIANEASSGAANSAWFYYVMDGKELSVVQAILYDAAASPDQPWYMKEIEKLINGQSS